MQAEYKKEMLERQLAETNFFGMEAINNNNHLGGEYYERKGENLRSRLNFYNELED